MYSFSKIYCTDWGEPEAWRHCNSSSMNSGKVVADGWTGGEIKGSTRGPCGPKNWALHPSYWLSVCWPLLYLRERKLQGSAARMPSFLSPLLLSVPLMLTGCSWWKSDQRDFLSFRWLSRGQLVLLLADRTPICAPGLSTAINEHVIEHCADNTCVNKHWSCSRVAKEAITL